MSVLDDLREETKLSSTKQSSPGINRHHELSVADQSPTQLRDLLKTEREQKVITVYCVPLSVMLFNTELLRGACVCEGHPASPVSK